MGVMNDEIRKVFAEYGRRGGLKTYKKYGKKHFTRIGEIGRKKMKRSKTPSKKKLELIIQAITKEMSGEKKNQAKIHD